VQQILAAGGALAIDKKVTGATPCWINKQSDESKSPAQGAGLVRKFTAGAAD
jgi:hypothetical protein